MDIITHGLRDTQYGVHSDQKANNATESLEPCGMNCCMYDVLDAGSMSKRTNPRIVVGGGGNYFRISDLV
ncbi:hypothetical protein VTN31DRAFT_1715 [Thermomyces dupontii]|uniref:uncharacterized protein n=1 Tax=Talaromyces thermophilus TaxID=28565 RepID=UPI003742782F